MPEESIPDDAPNDQQQADDPEQQPARGSGGGRRRDHGFFPSPLCSSLTRSTAPPSNSSFTPSGQRTWMELMRSALPRPNRAIGEPLERKLSAGLITRRYSRPPLTRTRTSAP